MERISGEVEGVVVGAGTVLNQGDYDRAVRAGARFVVSPGLMDSIEVGEAPLLPGIATATELMRALAAGFTCLKFFPAVPAGGVAMLKSFAPVFPAAVFCPTGGIGADNAPEFLALPNVACVGGSWVAPATAVRAGQWDRITELALGASQLLRS